MSHNRVTPGYDASDRPLSEWSGPELQHLAERRPEELYAAVEQLCRSASAEGPGDACVARAAGRIAETLADTRSRDCATFAVDIVGRLLPVEATDRGEADRLLRSVAAKLVKAQHLRDLEPLFGELPDGIPSPAVELRACLLGELALIGSGAGRRTLDAYAERLSELGHPLARLPRTRLDIEHRFTVRVRGLGPIKTPTQLRSRFPEVPSTDSGAVAGGRASDTRDDGRAEAAARPFTAGGWAREPEARFFTLPSPLNPDDFGMSFITELPLRCLAGEGGRRVSALACATTPDDVLNELFSASYNGGANGQGQGGAYARLYAWESLYALMGLPAGVPFLEAVRQATDHRWLRFMAFTDWFHHDTSDAAFAVLDPTRTRVTVLAATDTDVDRDVLG
ncbi:DUF6183 family protein [Streptomyces coeruleorubidus]|uniref:DUF6183 family protein n=1 Tax=Streptomyces coeruleorubidus TaxID=116188 RepID=A0ABZ0K7M9_STRC4|nr:DUF6183 family protein [Streptomyces coeruleorubidus]WOT33675.1 DUF6183 family protein [Streptomyces coeruleorubidus]